MDQLWSICNNQERILIATILKRRQEKAKCLPCRQKHKANKVYKIDSWVKYSDKYLNIFVLD